MTVLHADPLHAAARGGARARTAAAWCIALALTLAACPASDDASPTATSHAGSTSGMATGVRGTDTAPPSSDGMPDTADTADTADSGSDPSTTDPCVPGPSPTAEIGHGQSAFVPLADADAELVYGVQGGFHILLGLRTTGLDLSDAAIARFSGVIDGEPRGSSAPYAALRCTPDGTAAEALGLLLIWDTTPEMLHMRTATVQVELTDAAGTIVTSSGTTRIIDPNQK